MKKKYICVVVFLITALIGVIGYAYHAHDSAKRGWAEAEKIRETIVQIYSERIKRDIGLKNNTPTFEIALIARDFIYRQSKVGKETPMYRWERYEKTVQKNITHSCGGMAMTYQFMLQSLGIPARLVQLATHKFIEGKNMYDTHETVEVFALGKWSVFDPTFNVAFNCSDGKTYLSVPELKQCVESNYSIIPIKGKTQISGRTIEEYYLPYTDLLFAYHREAVRIKNIQYNVDAFPYENVFSDSMKAYSNSH